MFIYFLSFQPGVFMQDETPENPDFCKKKSLPDGKHSNEKMDF